jgi:hypothetical protein
MHRPDGCTHQTVQAIVDRGVRMLSLKTKYLVPGPIQADPHASMEFVFEQGNVVDQRTEMSRRSQDGDEPNGRRAQDQLREQAGDELHLGRGRLTRGVIWRTIWG